MRLTNRVFSNAPVDLFFEELLSLTISSPSASAHLATLTPPMQCSFSEAELRFLSRYPPPPTPLRVEETSGTFRERFQARM